LGVQRRKNRDRISAAIARGSAAARFLNVFRPGIFRVAQLRRPRGSPQTVPDRYQAGGTRLTAIGAPRATAPGKAPKKKRPGCDPTAKAIAVFRGVGSRLLAIRRVVALAFQVEAPVALRRADSPPDRGSSWSLGRLRWPRTALGIAVDAECWDARTPGTNLSAQNQNTWLRTSPLKDRDFVAET
jgi:hypothetical protein